MTILADTQRTVRPRGTEPSVAPPLIELLELEARHGPDGRAFVLEAPVVRIPAGSVTAIVGPSGAGKSTLLALLCGHFRSETKRACRWRSLRVRFGGEEILDVVPNASMRAIQDRATLVLQGGQLVSSLSLIGNCQAIARVPGRRILRLLREQGLLRLGSRTPDALSGGQHRRGLLVRALATSAELIALDEPCAGLDDLRAERTMRALIARARVEQRTVVWVTHDQALAQCLADRVIPIHHDPDSRRSVVGDARELRALPALNRTRLPRRARSGWAVGCRALLGASAWRTGGLASLVRQSLPIAFLAAFVISVLGVRSGAVEQLQADVRRSPTARRLWVSGLTDRGKLHAHRLRELVARSPALDVFVPVLPDLGPRTLVARDGRHVENVTLQVTTSADPLGPGSATMRDRDITLSTRLAAELGVQTGDIIRMPVGTAMDAPVVELRVAALRTERARVAYATFSLLSGLQRWLSGQTAPALGSSFVRTDATPKRPPARFDELLLLAQDPPSPRVKRELAVFGVLSRRPEVAADLTRALGVDSLGDLEIYSLRRPTGAPFVGTADPDLPTRARDVEALATSLWDVRVFPWTAPLDVEVHLRDADSRTVRLVGLSSSRPRWLASRTGSAVRPFAWNDVTPRLRGADLEAAGASILVGSPASRIPVRTEPAATRAGTALVPTSFLARLHALRAGRLVRRADGGFEPRRRDDVALVGAWAYARDVAHVAAARAVLERAGLAVRLDDKRAEEAVHTAGVLERVTTAAAWLVVPVAFVLCLFLFHASFLPLARPLSSLRVAGTPRRAGLAFLLVRGAAVGVLAAGVALVLAWATAAVLRGPLETPCRVDPRDALVVLGGLTVVAGVSALLAAGSIVRRDPLAVLDRAVRGS